VVHQQQFFRLPGRGLKFQVLNLQKRYDPGERVQLQIKVVNENDEPQVASHVGIRLWNEDYVSDDRKGLVMLDDVVRQQVSRNTVGNLKAELAQFGRPRSGLESAVALGGAMPSPRGVLPPGDSAKEAVGDLVQRDVRQELADLKKAEESAAAAAAAPPAPSPSGPAGGPQLTRSNENAADSPPMPADASIGGEGVPVENGAALFATSPMVFFDNAEQVTIASNKIAIDRQVQSLKSDGARALADWQATVGRVLIGGGLAALAILGLLFVMQQQVRWSSGTLVLVTSAASLVIGAAWITGGRQEMTIAIAPGSGGRNSAAAMPAPMEVAPKAANPRNEVGAATGSLPAVPPAEDAFAAPLGQALPAAAPTIAPAPPKAADGELESLAPAAAPLAAAAAADKAGDEAKGPKGALEGLAPAKPAPANPATTAIQPGGKNQEKPLEKKQVDDQAAVPAPASGGGLGGFGGGLGRGGPGGAPGSAPVDPRQGAADRPDSPKAAGFRAGGAARPAGTSPAPAAPSLAADVLRDLDRGSAGEKRKAADAAAAPSAIYFNPQLTADNSGIVMIEFQLPTVASEYRLLLDAYGNGRVGSSADVRIVCKAAE
jgi:hypothetical protein